MKRVTVVMPPELHKRLKFLSIQCDTTMNDLILRSVEKYLQESGYENELQNSLTKSPRKDMFCGLPIGSSHRSCSIYERFMPANFTSGWLGNGQAAWHGQGVVTEGTLPAREAFETAEALIHCRKARASTSEIQSRTRRR